MPFSLQELIESATLRWNTDFSQAALGEELATAFPWTFWIRLLDGSSDSFNDPIASRYLWAWFELDPSLRLDPGQVEFDAPVLRSHSLTTDRFVKGWEFDLDHLRTAMLMELYSELAQRIGIGVALTKHRTFWRAMLRGNTMEYGHAFDGQEMFSTSHPGRDASGNQVEFSNLFALPLDPFSLLTVVNAMTLYRDTMGNPYGNRWESITMTQPQNNRDARPAIQPSFHVAAGPGKAAVLHDIANTLQDEPSTLAGSFTWQTVEDLTGDYAEYWFVKFYDRNPARRQRQPVVWRDEGQGIFPTIGRDTEPGRLRQKGQMIVRANFGLAYDAWHCTAMSTGA